jgi:glutamate N-acetyltransferase / amino-acid N-acetyltransferase
MTTFPTGFTSSVANIGIKNDADDFVLIVADKPCPAAAVFTKSRFASFGHSWCSRRTRT